MSIRHNHDLHKTATIHLPPEPRAMDALGRNHTLEGALAELVDNSIDAHSAVVTVRFLEGDGSLTRIDVIDAGYGMGEDDINSAMTLGGSREYVDGEIGRFGFGLKAASFSQAESLTVLSRQDGGLGVGRRLARSAVSERRSRPNGGWHGTRRGTQSRLLCRYRNPLGACQGLPSARRPGRIRALPR
jgi:hypothetical protein